MNSGEDTVQPITGRKMGQRIKVMGKGGMFEIAGYDQTFRDKRDLY